MVTANASWLHPLRIVAVIRAETPEQGLAIARALARAGVKALEITLTIPGALDIIPQLLREVPPGVEVGVGSVVQEEEARGVLSKGARFLVSPVQRLSLIPLCHGAGVPCVIAGATPTEIVTAYEAEADLVKVFPVNALGGPLFVRELLEPLPQLPLMVSGGVNLENLQEYLDLGVKSLAVGSALMPRPLIRAGDYTALEEHAHRFVLAVNQKQGRIGPE